jgi:hypothetical protein
MSLFFMSSTPVCLTNEPMRFACHILANVIHRFIAYLSTGLALKNEACSDMFSRWGLYFSYTELFSVSGSRDAYSALCWPENHAPWIPHTDVRRSRYSFNIPAERACECTGGVYHQAVRLPLVYWFYSDSYFTRVRQHESSTANSSSVGFCSKPFQLNMSDEISSPRYSITCQIQNLTECWKRCVAM